MIARTLAHFPHAWLTCIGMLLFVGVFVGAVIWVFRSRSTEVYSRMSQLPFDQSPSEP